MLGLLWTMIIGVVVGAIARAIMPGEERGGLLATMFLGIGGAMVGRWLARLIGVYSYGGIAGMLFAVIGALALLWVWNRITRKDDGI